MPISDYVKKYYDIYATGVREGLDNIAQKSLDFLKTSGQASMRAYASLGGAVTGQKLTPSTYFQKELYGTDKPISLKSVGAEVTGEGKFGKLAIPVGLALGVGDIIPGGKQTKSAVITALKNVDKIEDAGKYLFSLLGVSKKVADKYAPLVAKTADELEITKIVDDVIAESQNVVELAKRTGKTLSSFFKKKPVAYKQAMNLGYIETNDSWGNEYFQIKGKIPDDVKGKGIKPHLNKPKVDTSIEIFTKGADTPAIPTEVGKSANKGFSYRQSVRFQVGDKDVYVDRKYLDVILKHNPNVEFKGSLPDKPIVAVENNKPVAVIMPVFEETLDEMTSVKLGMKESEQVIDPLISEARKYKSAEEFVNSKHSEMNGSVKTLEVEKVFSALPDGLTSKDGYIQKIGNKLFPTKKATPELLKNSMIELNKDGSIKEGFVLNRMGWLDSVDTKSQLTDIWNKVNAQSIPPKKRVVSQGAESKAFSALEDIKPKIEKVTPPIESKQTIPTISPVETETLSKQYTKPQVKAIAETAQKTGDKPSVVSRVVQSLKNTKTKVLEYVQNSEERVRQLTQKKGVKIDEATDPYLKMTLYSGRIANKVENTKNELGTIFKDIKKAGITREDVSNYLYYRHAPERNLALGEKAAGITTKEAEEGLKILEGKGVKQFADRVQKIHNQTLEMLHDSGVISDELFTNLRTKYKNHVPLQRIFEETEDIGQALSGKGFDVRSTGIKKAKGSEREVDDIFTNIVSNYEQAVLRSEKNIVDQATLAFVRNNKDILGDTIKETKLPIVPVAKVTHKGQIFNEVMDKVKSIVDKYGGQVERKLKTGKAFGYFNTGTNKITTRFGTSKDTLLHEFGHMLDTKFGLKSSDFFNRESLVELRKIADLRKVRQAYARKGEEKIAEFISTYFSDFKNAQRVAPKTTRKFTEFLKDKPELRELIDVMKSRSRTEERMEEIIFARQQFTNDPTILTMRENGKPTYIKFKDPELAIAFRGVGKEKLGGFLNAIATFTRFYSGLATRFNPEFALPNKLRDLQETMVYLASQKDVGFKGALKTFTRDPASTKDVLDAIRGVDTEGSKLYNEMKSLGGTTGGMGLSTKKQVELSLDKLENLANSKTKRIADNLVNYIDNWNTIFEDSTRLSVYKNAIKNGLSKERAAFLAKEASINFNRMGRGGPVLNAIWMFSNASIQGSVKMMQALKNPKVLGATLATVGGAVATTNEWNDKADPNWRDKVSKYDRLNGLPVVLPSEDDTFRYFTIPVSWGIKPLKVMADYSYDALDGQKFSIKNAMEDTTTSVLEAYNPVGGTDLTSAITPTVLDVPVELARNRAWSGSKIRPDFDPNAPKDIQYFDSLKETTVGQTAISISEFMQDKAGFAVSPADLKYAYEQYVGGAGRTATKFSNLITGMTDEEPLPLDEYPMLSRFYKERTAEEVGSGAGGEIEKIKSTLGTQSRERFKIKNEAEKLDKELQKMSGKEANEKVKQIKKDNPELYEKLKETVKDRKKGLNYEERLIKQLGVSNGERAKFINNKIRSLKTSKEKNEYFKELRKKGIISDEVKKQLIKLKKNEK